MLASNLARKNARVLGSLLVASAVGASLTGCELKTNAKRSADNSQQAAENSTKLLDLNQWAYGDGRQGGARERRENALGTMYAADSLEAKMASAAAYFSAMEYQTFKTEAGFREDDADKRVRMMTEGVSEFLKVQKDSLKEFTMPGTTIGWPATATLEYALRHEKRRDAFAFAGAMHKVSERQIEAAERMKFSVKSMLDLLAEGLAAKAAAEKDATVLRDQPAYVYEILRESADVIALLELRQNLFVGTALQAIVVPAKDPTPEAPVALTANSVKLQDATDRLKAALQTKAILAKAGVKARLYADVAKYLEMAVPLATQAVKASTEHTGASNRQLAEIQALLQKLAQ